MSIPQGFTVIKSAAFADRVVDLSKALLNDPLIGFHESNSANQRWIFVSVGDNAFTIETTTQDGATAFAHANIEAGSLVFGRTFSATFSPQQLPNGNWRICLQDNTQLAWTLPDENEGTNINLQPINNTQNQEWFFLPL